MVVAPSALRQLGSGLAGQELFPGIHRVVRRPLLSEGAKSVNPEVGLCQITGVRPGLAGDTFISATKHVPLHMGEFDFLTPVCSAAPGH